MEEAKHDLWVAISNGNDANACAIIQEWRGAVYGGSRTSDSWITMLEMACAFARTDVIKALMELPETDPNAPDLFAILGNVAKYKSAETMVGIIDALYGGARALDPEPADRETLLDTIIHDDIADEIVLRLMRWGATKTPVYDMYIRDRRAWTNADPDTAVCLHTCRAMQAIMHGERRSRRMPKELWMRVRAMLYTTS